MMQKPPPIEAKPPSKTPLQMGLIEFIRSARENGFSLGIAETIDAHRIAQRLDLSHSQHLRWGLRSLMCADQGDWERFDALFDAFWLPVRTKKRLQSMLGAPISPTATSGEGRRGPGQGSRTEADRPGEGRTADTDKDGTRKGASRKENLWQADFRFLSDTGQMHIVEDWVEGLARKMRRKIIRKEKLQHQGRRIHMRRTVRNSLRYGGTPLHLAFRRRMKVKPRLLLFVDVSRSMAMYSTVFLRFARGIVNAFSDAEAFAYHTKLVNITQALRQSDPVKRQHSLALISLGWSGGTRIAESLKAFNRDYAHRLNGRSIVVIVSDGLDTDGPEHIPSQLKKIKNRCRKLIWLNPLLGREGYKALTGSMVAALPLIDLFAPAHNLQSLIDLEPELIAL